jgi:hypothetical protein
MASAQEGANETGFPGCTTPSQTQAIDSLRSEIACLVDSPGGKYLVKMMGGEDFFYCR